MSVAATRPSLLLDLSQNALGDEVAEAISNALYHDKWLLGLNLSHNRISRVGIARLTDTLLQSNRTLAVILVNEMKDPGAHSHKVRRLHDVLRCALLGSLTSLMCYVML